MARGAPILATLMLAQLRLRVSFCYGSSERVSFRIDAIQSPRLRTSARFVVISHRCGSRLGIGWARRPVLHTSPEGR